MRKVEVEYTTTLPPWRFGHEKIEAEDLDSVKRKFHSKHEAAKLRKISEVVYQVPMGYVPDAGQI